MLWCRGEGYCELDQRECIIFTSCKKRRRRVAYSPSFAARAQYRSFPDPPNPLFPAPLTFLVGNVAQMRASPIPAPPSPPSLGSTARALRADLLSLKNDPQRMYDWLSVQAERLGRATDEGKMHCVLPTEGSVMVNSNLR